MKAENGRQEAPQHANDVSKENDALLEWITGTTMLISRAMDEKDIAAVLDSMRDRVNLLFAAERPGMQALQRLSALLTHVWLVMTDIERIEKQKRGKNKEIVDCFDDLERRIRCIREDLDRL